jgi:hypothetical protein
MRKKRTKAEIIAANNADGVERKQWPWERWCGFRHFSVSQGRYLRKAGLAPKIFWMGRLMFVAVEDDAEWYVMWRQGGDEKFKQWSREQRKLREECEAAAEQQRAQEQVQ